MSLYEERLQRDLSNLKLHLGKLNDDVQKAVKDCARALLEGDDELAYSVVLADMPINRASRELDRLCHSFIAVHLPSAGHLRFVSSLMRVNLELERIGDYAVTVCRESVQLSARPLGDLARDAAELAGVSLRMLAQANACAATSNAAGASVTMKMSDQIGRAFDLVLGHLTAEQSAINRKDTLAYMVIFNALRRVGRQAKNICEEAVFAATGETKAAKVYHILFLDEDNASLGPMALAVARRHFPGSGHYETAGRRAVDRLDPGLVNFLGERGMDLGDLKPQTLEMTQEQLAGYHVIVGLQGAAKSYVDPVPFHTIVQEWSVGEPPTDAGGGMTQDYEAAFREISIRVRDLITTLRGEEAP